MMYECRYFNVMKLKFLTTFKPKIARHLLTNLRWFFERYDPVKLACCVVGHILHKIGPRTLVDQNVPKNMPKKLQINLA